MKSQLIKSLIKALCCVGIICLSSSILISASSLRDDKLQFFVPNPFQRLNKDQYYLIESTQEIYERGSSGFVRKQVSEYFNLETGDYFSYHTNVNDYKPVGEPTAFISNANKNQMFYVTNPNGYPQFECKIDETNKTRSSPWSYEWPLESNKVGHLYGISGLWLSAIREKLKSSIDSRDPENWNQQYNLWFKNNDYYNYEIGFSKPTQTADMDEDAIRDAVSKTLLEIGKVTEYSEAKETPNRQYQVYRYFWVQKFLARVQASQDIQLRQLIIAKEKCMELRDQVARRLFP